MCAGGIHFKRSSFWLIGTGIFVEGGVFNIKTDKHFHGIGMKSVKKIVEKYEGQLEYDNKQNIFEVSITLFWRSKNCKLRHNTDKI